MGTNRTELKWTARDEAALEELQARRMQFMSEKRAPLLALATGEGAPMSSALARDLVEWLIENADALRDALEPFDSGVRPG